MNQNFKVDDKVKLSKLAKEHHIWCTKKKQERKGIVVSVNCRDDDCVRILWDGNKNPETVNESFLEKI